MCTKCADRNEALPEETPTGAAARRGRPAHAAAGETLWGAPAHPQAGQVQPHQNQKSNSKPIDNSLEGHCGNWIKWAC